MGFQGYLDVGSMADLWDFMQETVVPHVFMKKHYNGDNVNEDDLSFMKDSNFLRLGPPSLRQFRVKPRKFFIPCE